MQVENDAKFAPTDAVIATSVRGLALQKSFNRGKVKDKVVKSKMTLNEVKDMYRFLVKEADFFDPLQRETDGGPSESIIDFLSYGGKCGLAWCRSILREENILKSYTKEIKKSELETEHVVKGFEWKIEKATNEELMQVTYVAMLPDTTDLHGDFTSAEEVRKAMESFNKSAMRANLFHRVMTDSFEVIESYLAPTDFVLGEIPVKKGTWLMTLQVHDDSLWQMIKSGDISGISIGAVAIAEDVEDE